MKITKKKATAGLIALLILTLLFFLHYIKILTPVENVIVRIFLPIEKKFVDLSDRINSYYQEERSRKTLENQIEILEKDLLLAQERQSQLVLVEEENKFLREQLDFKIDENYEKVVANVISKSPDETINTITVNRGLVQGVVLGSPATISEGTLIGKVIRVENYHSVILLINDHNSQVAASIINNDKTVGIVKGEYGLGAKMQLIPQTEKIMPDDIIVTSGIEENIPRGLFIGTVDLVNENQGDVFKEAVIKLPYNLNKISLVNILAPKIDAKQNP